MVGAAREPGTSMLIEDVACPVEKLADMIIDLNEMFTRLGYPNASCFGHALEGNLHLVFAQVGVWGAWGGVGGRLATGALPGGARVAPVPAAS
jgi:hypothetical protein